MKNQKHKKNLLCFGADGQLGSEVSLQAQKINETEEPWRFIPVTEADLDLRDNQAIQPFLEAQSPDFIINCAAYTDVEGAEENESLAYAVNADAVEQIALYAAKVDSPIIHISTDYLFDGRGNQPLTPDDPVNPINVYGRSKAVGEEKLRNTTSNYIIFRTSWLFGAYGKNFVTTMLRLGQEKDTLSVISDQFGNPTGARSLAQLIWRAFEIFTDDPDQMPRGTYHACNKPDTTWYGFAAEIFEQVRGHNWPSTLKNLQPVSTEDYPSKAERPLYTVMNCDQTETDFNYILPEWRKELDHVIQLLTR